MIVTCNRIRVNAAYREAFEDRFKNRAGMVETMPGFVAYHFLRPQQDDGPYVVMTYWQSMEAFKAWTESEAFQQGHGRSGTLPPEAYAGRPELEIFDVVDSETA